MYPPGLIEKIYHFYLESTGIQTDSRRISKGEIFFALRGDHFDGNEFAPQALAEGASLAVVSDRSYDGMPGFIWVDDTLEVLQHLAMHQRRQFKGIVLAITGTNGKTTTKELLARVLSSTYRTYATKGNLNNHIGVPLTLLEANRESEYIIVEMGANHPGEIQRLCEIAQPDLGLITNIGKAHLEGFGGFEGVIRAKSELYEYLRANRKKVLINTDNPILTKIGEGIDRITYGMSGSAYCKGTLMNSFPFVDLKVISENKAFRVKSNLMGKYNAENILAAVCMGIYAGITPETIAGAVSSYIPQNFRSQILKTKSNTLLLDAYNANPSSMQAAIENFAESDYPGKILILGEMLELGQASQEEHRNLLDMIRRMDLREVYLIGKGFQSLVIYPERWYESADKFTQYLQNNPIKNKTILLKGSRGNALENLIKFL